MFKFTIHMMQSPGTHEGLRNLIETTLPATLRAIMEIPDALGYSIYAHGNSCGSDQSVFVYKTHATKAHR
jgi:hypothetical protein